MINEKHILLNMEAKSKEDALKQIAQYASNELGLHDKHETLYQELIDREAVSTTGMEDGFAIPHAIGTVKKPAVMVVKFKGAGVEWKAFDGKKTKIAIVLLIPKKDASKIQMDILSSIATSLLDEKFRTNLKNAKTKKSILTIMEKVIAKKGDTIKQTATKGNKGSFVAVTSCAAGIAHTFMAAEALVASAKENGYEAFVEKQGAGGTEDKLTQQQIENADFVIIAADLKIKEEGRFAGKPVYLTNVKEPIHAKAELVADLDNALNKKESKRSFTSVQGDGAAAYTQETKGEGFKKWKALPAGKKAIHTSKLFGRTLQKSTMGGISYLVPLIVAGGILGALGLLIATLAVPSGIKDEISASSHKVFTPAWQYMTGRTIFKDNWNVARLFKTASYYVFDIGVPVVLGGYTAFAIADKPAIVPGMLGGLVAAKFKPLHMYDLDLSSGGFIGGLFAGWLAGGIIYAIKLIPVHKNIKGLMTLFIYPVAGSAFTLLGMFYVLGPLATIINKGVMDALTAIEASAIGAVGLGFIVGGLMCIDMGGPINKATLAFAYAAMANQDATVYGAVAAAKITPEFVTSLAVWIKPKWFTTQEVAQGRFVNPILGLTGITEGAIPFVLNDWKRIIPSTFIGGGIAGAISMAAAVKLNVIGAGVFSAAFMGSDSWIWLLGIVGASIAGAGILLLLKWAQAKEFKIRLRKA